MDLSSGKSGPVVPFTLMADEADLYSDFTQHTQTSLKPTSLAL
jgi:hypothetical protein